MNLFVTIYAIFSLVVLTSKISVAHVKNVSHKGTGSAKVLTNLLKVPWMNVNSSWEDKVKSTCGNDIKTLFEKADDGEMWALQMLDASSKIPSGYFRGNIRDLGMFDECISTKSDNKSAEIQGQHCMVSLSMPSKFVENVGPMLYLQKLSVYNPSANVDLSFTMSVCLPSSCSVDDVEGFINASIESSAEIFEFGVSVVQVTCSRGKPAIDFTLGMILALSFFATVAILLVFCTVCDFVRIAASDHVSPALRTIAKFSLYSNAMKLFRIRKDDPETMSAIHGIRFLSSCSIVTVHKILSVLMLPMSNLSDIYMTRNSLVSAFALSLSFPVDTFFIISGFLLTYFSLKRLQSGKKMNLIWLYVLRYIRLTPCIVALLLFTIFIFPYLGSGPIWETIIGVTSGFCRRNWWTNILYVQNFVNQYEMCMPHTWYMAVEMQLFWISPIILYPLFYRPKLGLAFLVTILIASLITPVVLLIVNQYAYLFNFTKNFKDMYNEFFNFYTVTYNRAFPYFLGILLGYCMVNYNIRINKVVVALNWILTGVFLIFCLWSSNFIQPNTITYDPFWEAIYISVGRVGWGLAVSWMIYACIRGHGGPVAKFLSLPIFVPLSRLSYCIYLVSVVIQVGINSATRLSQHQSHLSVVYAVLSDLAISIIAAFILNLCFESPVIVWQKMLEAKHSPSTIIKRASMRRKDKLLAIIREYLNLTRGWVTSDLEIENRMAQADFWHTVSTVLAASGKKSTKTPAEWAMVWQNCKCDLLTNDNEQETRGNDIQEGSARSQTGITKLEKELLIFLAAVSCGLDDRASVEEAKIVEPSRSRRTSWNLRDADPNRLSTLDSTRFTQTMSKFSGPTSAEK